VILSSTVAVSTTAATRSDAADASAPPGLTTGFDSYILVSNYGIGNDAWLGRAVDEGAGVVRVDAAWLDIAPTRRPRGFDPSDPASPGYDWTTLDAEIRAMSSHGLRVLLMLFGAPRWAQGPGRPSTAGGTWRPSPTQFADFARAAAIRYSGHYPDPGRSGQFLPRVKDWQAWNEPNLGYFLNPQYVRTRGGWTAESPQIYRRLLNSFYSAVKAVDRSNFVVAGGTAPYGDPGPRGGGFSRWRVRPIRFYRQLFCLNADLHRSRCDGPVHFDALDNHPYTFGPPTMPPYWRDDVDVADVWKIGHVLQAGEQAGTARPRGHKQIWSTEISWDSTPPSHLADSVPVAKQARYLEQALYELWRQGVSTVLWDAIRDIPEVSSNPNFVFNYGGLYYASGTPKPAAIAFRFPFVTQRLDSRHVRAWGRAPVGGRLLVEREVAAGHWRVLTRLDVGPHRVFETKLHLMGRARLRAQIGSMSSLAWRQAP
jgi:hypothetical protein